MNGLAFAKPWWVNLCLLVPLIVYYCFRKNRLQLPLYQLALATLFGVAFGLVEAAVVVYLRTAVGLLDPATLGGKVIPSEPVQILALLPPPLLLLESFREAATITVLVCVAMLAAHRHKERLAILLWIFGTWDIFYYVFLWFALRWPSSLTSADVLFLIPVPWLSQIWFPLLVSHLTMLSILITRDRATTSNRFCT